LNALRKIIAHTHPDTDSQISPILSRSLVESWMTAMQGGRTLDRRTRRQVNISINSTYKHARDVFARKLMDEKYAHLKLPDLQSFLSVPLLPTPAAHWTRIPRTQLEAMMEAAETLRHTKPDLWRVNLLLRRLGLRNSELAAARRNWIIETETGHALAVEDRPDYQLKGVRPRTLPLSPDVAEAVLSVEPPDAHLILPLGNKTDRLALIEREHNQWLRPFIPDRIKGNHELRKHAGSMVLTNHGLAAAQRFLGHSSQLTTERWYATYLQDLPAITLADEVSFATSPHTPPPHQPSPAE